MSTFPPRGLGYAWALAFTGFAGAITSATADVIVLAALGSERWVLFFALSSALMVVTMPKLGSRFDRGTAMRDLLRIALIAALLMACCALFATRAESAANSVALLLAKQSTAALELGIWVGIAETFDARDLRNRMPTLLAAFGGGALVGGSVVGLAWRAGSPLLLGLGALAFAGVGLIALRIANPALPQSVRLTSSAAFSHRELRTSRLLRTLFFLITAGAIVAPLAYVALAEAAQATFADATALARFWGIYRGGLQLAVVIVGAASWMWLDRLGIALSLRIVPFVALLFAMSLVFAPHFAWLAATYALARLAEGALQTPSERVALGLFARESRGRAQSFVEGMGKRSGVALGALLAVAAAHSAALAYVCCASAAMWAVIAWRYSRRIGPAAVAELSLPTDQSALTSGDVGLAQLRMELRTAAVVPPDDELSDRRIDLVAEIIEAAHATHKDTLWMEAVRVHVEEAKPLSKRARAALSRHAERSTFAEFARERLLHGLASDPPPLSHFERHARTAESADDPTLPLCEMTIALLVHARRDLGSADLVEPLRAMCRELRYQEEATVACLLPCLRSVVTRAQECATAEWMLCADYLRESCVRWAGSSLPECRDAALRMLGSLATPPLLEWLSEQLAHPDPVLRAAAEAALRNAGEAALLPLLATWAGGKRRAAHIAERALTRVRVTPATLETHVAQLGQRLQIQQETMYAAAHHGLSSLVQQRLRERRDEQLAQTILLLSITAQQPALRTAVRRFVRTRDRRERSRIIEAMDTLLPRNWARQLISVMADERAAGAMMSVAALHEAIAIGDDQLAAQLLMRDLVASGQSSRDFILRAASLQASAQDPLASLRRIHMSWSQEEGDMPRAAETITALGAMEVFRSLSTRQLADLAAAVRWQSFEEGRHVVREGEPARTMYFVYSGKLRVHSGSQGDLGLLIAGDYFGEFSLLGDEVRSATVTTIEPSLIGAVEAVVVEELIEQDPGLALAICRGLIRRMRK